ncbi:MULTISPECIES: aminoglycoside phosphotransferase family protein [unclassified Roseovarius]|uniref:aminoglycoside phosphotransferase family protein n=1 Tax=unclassified Roseovarius TaxID=2614913 RepID=UPI00274018F1|nr:MULTISPECIES: phosphotransferase [unclassified Roseovarius]
MTDRAALAQAFLAQTEWADATSSLLAGDASNRKYHRLWREGSPETAVLMDAPPDKGEDVRPFVRIAQHLTTVGLSAPRIFAEDAQHGFLLLEDLGDALFARAIPEDPTLEPTLYTAATDALIVLHEGATPPGLAAYDADIMTDMAALAFDWYATGAGVPNQGACQAFHKAMHAVLIRHAADAEVLIQRDYHAENLLWLPERDGVARVGLLDFQDAMVGHRAYDLVSLLQDARRDVPPAIEAEMIAHYVTVTGADREAFETAYRCLGAQRNLRILGVFARLCMRDGKRGYIDLIPRVWHHLQADLTHPALSEVAAILANGLPEPTPAVLQKLSDKCATVPAL